MFEKSKYLNKASWSFYKNNSPYPFALIEDFLKPDIYKRITETFPDLNKFEYNGDIHGNNIQIRIPYNEFSFEKHSFWYEFGSYFLQEDFFYNFCEIYKDDIKHWYPEIFKKLINKSFKIGISNINSFDDCDILLDFQIGINTPVTKVKSVRGPHLDNKKSLYTALCYLKDEDDQTDSGHFTIYNLKPFKLLKLGSGRAVDLADVTNFKEIKYKSNRLATFMNTKKSIHGVTQREATDKIRKFFAFNAVYKEDLYKIPYINRFLSRINKFRL